MHRNSIILVTVLALICLLSPQVEASAQSNETGSILDVIAKIRGTASPSAKKIGEHKLTVPLQTSPYWSSQVHGASIWGVSLADINNDRYPEVITTIEQDFNYIYYNNHGLVESTASWVSGDWGYNIEPAFGDYDNDGDLDMAVACYQFAGGLVKVYGNNGDSLTRDPVWVAQRGGGTSCEWGDFDNDGDLDLAIADMFASPMVFRNNSGTMEGAPCWQGTDYDLDFGVAWIDVDNDGDLDLAVGGINWQEPCLRIYRNNGGTLEDAASWTSALSAGDNPAIGISVCDLDRDGWLDVGVACGFSANAANVLFKNLHDSLERNPSWTSGDALASGFSLFGEITGDQYPDWIVNNGDCGSVYENNNGSLNPAYTWNSNESGGLGIDLGDVDQDGVGYREDTVTAPGTKKLFYLSRLPIQKITGITINGNPVQIGDYCCNLNAGWVSFKNSITQNSLIIFKYNYSSDLELLLSDYNTNECAYLYRNTTVGIAEQGSKHLQSGAIRVFPNPVRSGSSIALLYALQHPSSVKAEIYDCTGKRILNLFERQTSQGLHKDVAAINLASGVYFLRLEFDDKDVVEKISVISK